MLLVATDRKPITNGLETKGSLSSVESSSEGVASTEIPLDT